MGGTFDRQGGPQQLEINILEREPADLASELGTFDLLYSIEVAEHMEKGQHEHVVAVFAALSRKGTKLIFGAATPGQAGTGHIGMRPVKQWAELWEAGGFVRHAEETQLVKQTVETYNHKKNVQVFYYGGKA
tara:strand:- start:100 stop:495 length:396 start_codon:yes stop_codon:yes gene_type:complete